MILPLKPAVIGPFSGIFHRHLPSPAHVRVENGPGLPQKVSQQSCYGSAMVVGIWVGVQIFFFGSGCGFFKGFLSWYHLPCICNSLELESVILHGICYVLVWLLCILHGICYIWQCSPSILHGISNVLALQPLICMVFATFWYFKRSCVFFESFFRLSFRASLGFH